LGRHSVRRREAENWAYQRPAAVLAREKTRPEYVSIFRNCGEDEAGLDPGSQP
jgi:hypothetical protein